jgi:hypothetical protein
MKCDFCGKESDLEAAFIKEYRSFHRTDLMLCPACWIRRQHASVGRRQIAILAGGLMGYVLLRLDPSSVPGWFLTRFFMFNLFLFLAIIPHELGHAIAGHLVGWRVFSVAIGIGKQFFKFRLFGIIFALNWLPIGGATVLAPTRIEWFRTKHIITLISGPAVNAAMAATILWLWWGPVHERGLSALPHLARFYFFANLGLIALNLWPQESKAFGTSDGKQLLKTFSKTGKDAERFLAARFVWEAAIRRDEYKDSEGALNWCNDGLVLFPRNFSLLNMSGSLCLDTRDYGRAREIFLQLLPDQTKPGRKRYSILNNIAYSDALIDDPSLLPEADAYSKEAYGSLPWVPAIAGTRGTVLVEMGRYEEGIKLLKESTEKHETARGKALNTSHLAIAYARMGDHDQADRYIKTARQLDPRCFLLERAEAELRKRNSNPVHP